MLDYTKTACDLSSRDPVVTLGKMLTTNNVTVGEFVKKVLFNKFSTFKTAAHFLNNSFSFAGFGNDDAWQYTILFTMQPNASHVLCMPLRIPHGSE